MRRPAQFLLIVFGCVLGLVFIECGLRLGGLMYYDVRMRGERNVALEDADEIARGRSAELPQAIEGKMPAVVCVGDSYTFGIGAPPGRSYPAQLQKLLVQNGCRYAVYNCGMPGLTAQSLAGVMPSLLEKYHPRIVVLLIGLNDANYPFVSDLYAMTRNEHAFLKETADLLAHSRLYHLLEYIRHGLHRRWTVARRRKVNPEMREAANRYTMQAIIALGSGRTEHAENLFKLASRADPDNELLHLSLGHYYQRCGRYDESIAELAQVIRINPYTEHRRAVYRILFLLYNLVQSPEQRTKIRGLTAAIPSDEKFAAPSLPFLLREASVGQLREQAIERTLALARKQGTVVILQTYTRDETVNRQLRIIADRNGLPLVDNGKVFSSLPRPLDYLGYDGSHPNAEGYRIFAEGVLRQIMQMSKTGMPEEVR